MRAPIKPEGWVVVQAPCMLTLIAVVLKRVLQQSGKRHPVVQRRGNTVSCSMLSISALFFIMLRCTKPYVKGVCRLF